MLEQMLNGYDKRLRPNFAGKYQCYCVYSGADPSVFETGILTQPRHQDFSHYLKEEHWGRGYSRWKVTSCNWQHVGMIHARHDRK